MCHLSLMCRVAYDVKCITSIISIAEVIVLVEQNHLNTFEEFQYFPTLNTLYNKTWVPTLNAPWTDILLSVSINTSTTSGAASSAGTPGVFRVDQAQDLVNTANQ